MKRRIAMISEHASPLGALGGVDSGGQNVYVGQVSRNLADLGYEVDVFTRRDSNRVPRVVRWIEGVRIIHVPAGPPVRIPKEHLLPSMGEFTAYVLRCCHRIDYDLVHANFFMSGLVAADLKCATGIPFVVTFHALGRVRRLHQAESDGFPEERLEIEDRIIAEADRIIAECPQDEEDLICLYGANPGKITVIPCGFDPEEFWPVSKAAARIALGLDPDHPVLLQLGRMVPRKGVDTVIRALGHLSREAGMSPRLLIVGGESDEPDARITPEIGRLRRIAEEEGLSDEVVFVGRRGRGSLKYYFSAADIFITTPWYEPFGITPVEAMACGTPVIGSRVGGIKFTVREGENGYLVPPNDPEALAEQIAHLYRNPELLTQFGRQAIRRANSLFTWQRVTSAVANLYEEVIPASHLQRYENAVDPALIDLGLDALLQPLQKPRWRTRPAVLEAVDRLSRCLAQGGKALVCGQATSAQAARYLASELAGRYGRSAPAGSPALVLSGDFFTPGTKSDVVREGEGLARQLEMLGRPGDIVLAFGSVPGASRWLVRVFEAAHELGLYCVAIGGSNDEIAQFADLTIPVPTSEPERTYELHTEMVHLLCRLLEKRWRSGRRPRALGESASWPPSESRAAGARRRTWRRAVTGS